MPGLTALDLAWGAHFMIGSMAHSLAAGEILRFISRGQVDETDTEETYERLVAFASAGLQAMASAKRRHA